LTEQPAEEIRISTRHLHLGAKRWSADGGLPFLGLHGWLDNASTFDRLAPLLPRLDLVSLDLPGHGRSDHRPAGTRYHYTDYVDEVMAAVDALGWDRFTLLGHSMGAGIGCFVAGAYPDRVEQLILIESLGPVTETARDMPDLLRSSVEAMKFRSSNKSPTRRDLGVLIRARATAGRLTRASAELLVRRSVRQRGAGFEWCSDSRLKHPMPQYFGNALIQAYLQGICAPVLLIVAEDGLLRRRGYFRTRCRAIRDLQRVVLPGHHHLHLDNPGPVAEAIMAFLDKT
jgi:pimeloyl-ACP methyl ester carboxylesterase